MGLAAARPPAPLQLADPAAFGMLDLEASATLRVTKRDCKTWFDQLSVHPDIGLYFGRPRVTRSELHGEGWTDPDILAMGGEPGQPSFVPCSNVWPTGFSWSSCVAQATLLSICAEAHLADEQVLACDCPLPDSLDMAFAVATDDLMIFSDRGPGATAAAARAVEQVMLRHNMEKKPDKDVNDALSTTCVGVDLLDGLFWSPPGARLWTLLDGLLDLVSHGVRCDGDDFQPIGSRVAVAGFLGVAQ